ncbi:MAG: hypothetical protein RLZZ381_2255 [Cyanobacteriota bacterium]|jgi:hypothetical protein
MFDRLTNLSIQSQALNYWLNRLIAVALILIVSWVNFCSSATALLRQHHETPSVLRYHAQDSLKDRNGNTWQVLLFPENNQNQQTTYYLRLVGFPGVNSFNHPEALEILTSGGKVFTATDAYTQLAPVPNVGQYDFTSIINQLPGKQSLKLSVPLQDNQELALKIPPEVLTEWLLLTQEIE